MKDVQNMREERTQIYRDVYDNKIPKRVPIDVSLSLTVVADYGNIDRKAAYWDPTLLQEAAEKLLPQWGFEDRHVCRVGEPRGETACHGKPKGHQCVGAQMAIREWSSNVHPCDASHGSCAPSPSLGGVPNLASARKLEEWPSGRQ